MGWNWTAVPVPHLQFPNWNGTGCLGAQNRGNGPGFLFRKAFSTPERNERSVPLRRNVERDGPFRSPFWDFGQERDGTGATLAAGKYLECSPHGHLICTNLKSPYGGLNFCKE